MFVVSVVHMRTMSCFTYSTHAGDTVILPPPRPPPLVKREVGIKKETKPL